MWLNVEYIASVFIYRTSRSFSEKEPTFIFPEHSYDDYFVDKVFVALFVFLVID